MAFGRVAAFSSCILCILFAMTSATYAQVAWQVLRGSADIRGAAIALGEANTKWAFPADQWNATPLGYEHAVHSTEPLTDFTLSCTVHIDGATLALPPYDTAFSVHSMSPALFFYHAGILLRAGDGQGYRLLLSSVSHDIALYKENVGFVAVCPAPIEAGTPAALTVRVVGNRISAQVNGDEVLDYFDTKRPFRSGVLGFVATHARVTVSAIAITRAAPKDEVVTRIPNLHLREWLHWPWIFDGDEPIARVMLYDIAQLRKSPDDNNGPYRFFGLAEVKLRPGVESSLPFQFDWESAAPEGKRQAVRTVTQFAPVTSAPGDMQFAWEVMNAAKAVTGRGTLTVRYDATQDGYVYEVQSSRILTQPYERNYLEFADIRPSWSVGPASTATTSWTRKYQYGVFTEESGALYKSPLNHHYTVGGTLKSGGYVGYVGDGEVNPVFEVLSNGLPVTVAFGNQGMNLQLRYALPQDVLPLPAGKEVQARFRVLSYPPAKAKALLANAAFPPEWYQTVKDVVVPLNTGQALNRFGASSWAKATDSFDGWAWVGATGLNWDRTVGYDDTDSLKLEGGTEVRTRIGESDFFGPFDKPAYIFRCQVKSENVVGNGLRLSIEKDGRIVRSGAVTGTSAWTPLSVQLAGPYAHANLVIKLEGKGTAWVDNVEFVPAE